MKLLSTIKKKLHVHIWRFRWKKWNDGFMPVVRCRCSEQHQISTIRQEKKLVPELIQAIVRNGALVPLEKLNEQLNQ